MLQYRSAALAGFATQCWWGGIKVMILTAFYDSQVDGSRAPITLAQAITYTWMAQAFLSLTPWSADPDIGRAIRDGSILYDRLRPVDAYAFWYARAAGWLASRVLPRAALMLAASGVVLPLLGLLEWAWRGPGSTTAALQFAVSIVLSLLLSAALVMLFNLLVVITLNERGVNALAAMPVILLSGNLLPLPLFPESVQTLMLVQPLAGLIDIPLRIYSRALVDAAVLGALGLQVFWIAVLVGLGHWMMRQGMQRLEVQGG